MRPLNPIAWFRRIESVRANRLAAAAGIAILATGFIDHFTGPIISLTVIYLVPVALTAWAVGRTTAHALALLAAITWAVADRIGPLAEPKAPIAYLNDATMLIVFLFVNVVISSLRNSIDRQHETMREVQRHLLPVSMPRIPGIDIASRWIPAWTVAGDYYDVIDAGSGRIAICLADVSGKGTPAALVMANVQATVRALIENGLPPDRTLAALNRTLHERVRPGVFVTIFCAVLDTPGGDLTFASAGHNPAFLRRNDGTLVRLEHTGPVAGVFADAEYRCVSVDIGTGDRVILYSDGVTEFENAAGEEFSEQRLHEVVSRDPGRSAEESCEAIVDGLRAFGGDRPYNDDVTILVVLRTAAAELPLTEHQVPVPEPARA